MYLKYIYLKIRYYKICLIMKLKKRKMCLAHSKFGFHHRHCQFCQIFSSLFHVSLAKCTFGIYLIKISPNKANESSHNIVFVKRSLKTPCAIRWNTLLVLPIYFRTPSIVYSVYTIINIQHCTNATFCFQGAQHMVSWPE